MASSSIKLPITQDVLYSGDKWASGAKTIEWEKYDFIVFQCRTNTEYPAFYYDTKLGNGPFETCITAYDPAAGWLNTRITFTFATNTITPTLHYNNANWTLGCIKIIGIKIN